MGYYIRVLGTKDPDISLNKIIEGLAKKGLTASIILDENDTPEKWSMAWVSNQANEEILEIERNPVIEGQLGFDELEEFRESIADEKPTSAAVWLDKYFDKVTVIYALRFLGNSDEDENYAIIDNIRETILHHVGGIFQADHEGFTNEEGNHILWQFDDSVTGLLNCAVLDNTGKWLNFTMDIGNQNHREAFKNGKLPQQVSKFAGFLKKIGF